MTTELEPGAARHDAFIAWSELCSTRTPPTESASRRTSLHAPRGPLGNEPPGVALSGKRAGFTGRLADLGRNRFVTIGFDPMQARGRGVNPLERHERFSRLLPENRRLRGKPPLRAADQLAPTRSDGLRVSMAAIPKATRPSCPTPARNKVIISWHADTRVTHLSRMARRDRAHDRPQFDRGWVNRSEPRTRRFQRDRSGFGWGWPRMRRPTRRPDRRRGSDAEIDSNQADARRTSRPLNSVSGLRSPPPSESISSSRRRTASSERAA